MEFYVGDYCWFGIEAEKGECTQLG